MKRGFCANWRHRALFIFLSTALLQVISARAGINDGLVAHYPFNGSTLDTSGTNNGVSYGGVAFTNGINTRALKLSKEGDYVRIPPDSKLGFDAASKTMSVWLKAGIQLHNQNSILDKSSTSDYSLDILTNTNPNVFTIRFRVHDGNSFQYISGLISKNAIAQWLNAVVIKNGSIISFYTNTSLVGTIAVNGVKTKTNALIVGAGGSPYTTGYSFTGMIEDLRFYNRALTADEIRDLYLWSYPMLSISRAPDFRSIIVNWNATCGNTYRLQYKDDINATNWSNLSEATIATNGSLVFYHTNGMSGPLRFYRVVILP